MENIIKQLYKEEGKFEYEAVKLAKQNIGKINDFLLEEINKINKDLKTKKIEYAPLFLDYAVFLLAEFKDKRLYPVLMELLNLPKVKTFDVFGMGIMDKLPSIIASIFDGNFQILNEIIENKELDEYTRSRALATYHYFYDNNMIAKEDLETYLKKLLKIYNYEYDGINNQLIDIVIDAKIFNMIKDIRKLFAKNAVDLDYRGGYDSFIDDLFSYDDKYKEKIYQIEDTVKEMSWWACFKKEKEEKEDFEKMFKKLSQRLEEEITSNSNAKVGRNDPCPCGSGKKFKKCCIDKQKETLPYQKYIDASLNKYPKKNANKDEIDFYTYYKEEYINIDKLIYKALKRKAVPMMITRDHKAEAKIEYNALNEAFPLIKAVLNNNKFKCIEEYDEKVSIHFSLYEFFAKYSELLIDRIKEDKNKYLPKLEELLTFFSTNFNIEDNVLFMDRKNAYYINSKKQEEGIKYFENLILNSKTNKEDIYGYLFDEYMSYYDYDIAKNKIEEAISKEKDKKLVNELQELKLEFLDDEEDYGY